MPDILVSVRRAGEDSSMGVTRDVLSVCISHKLLLVSNIILTFIVQLVFPWMLLLICNL